MPDSNRTTYEWKKEGRVLTNNSVNGVLNVSISSSEDFGVYTCHAITSDGVTSYNISVCRSAGDVKASSKGMGVHRNQTRSEQSSICCVSLTLYNNQINARALIGQSAMVYCASKLMEISRVFSPAARDLRILLQLWFIVPVNSWKFRASSRLRLVIYEFFSCSSNIPRGLSAYKP